MSIDSTKTFYQCPQCSSIYIKDKPGSNQCAKCGSPQLLSLTGRFILRCKTCGLTQNKAVFSVLHGVAPIRCQTNDCSGLIKVISIGNSMAENETIQREDQPPIVEGSDKKHPVLPKRRSLKSEPQTSHASVLADTLATKGAPKLENKSFTPFPTETSTENNGVKSLKSLHLSQFQPFPSVSPNPIQLKNHAGITVGDRLKLGEDIYEITAKIGMGGMGAIHQARNSRTNKLVVIKEYYSSRYHDPETGLNHCEKYWIREADITEIQMTSPELCMHYIGRLKLGGYTSPEYYIFLEFIDGINLDKWYTDKYKNVNQLTPKELRMFIKDILMPITRHMYYVHQHGIVHRDLTVQNILICKQGVSENVKPVVIDWGVAKEIGMDKLYNPRKPYYISSAPEATGIRNRGTPPEVMAGFEPIAATDIYMLGHIMYFLFSGGHYASAAATNEDFVLHPGDLNPTLPSEFNKLVEYMTQYEPADRMPTMVKVYDALQWLYEFNQQLETTNGLPLKKAQYYLYCEYNQALIQLSEKEVIRIGRDEVLKAGRVHEMDGHLHNALIPTNEGQFSFELYIDGGFIYIQDIYSKLGTFISNLTSTNQQVYHNIPIKGLDNVCILLSEANLGKTTIEIPFVAQDGNTYRIPFKILTQ